MNKKTAIFFLLLFIVFESNADPIKYKFQGTVDAIYGNGPSRTRLGLNPGSSVSFVFLINTSAAGYRLWKDGTFELSEDGEDTQNYFAKLLYMSYFVNETYYHFHYTDFVGTDDFCTCFPDGPIARIFAGPPMLYFDGPYPRSSWTIGQQIGGIHGWHDSVTQEYISMFFSLTVTEITQLPTEFKGMNYSESYRAN